MDQHSLFCNFFPKSVLCSLVCFLCKGFCLLLVSLDSTLYSVLCDPRKGTQEAGGLVLGLCYRKVVLI